MGINRIYEYFRLELRASIVRRKSFQCVEIPQKIDRVIFAQ